MNEYIYIYEGKNHHDTCKKYKGGGEGGWLKKILISFECTNFFAKEKRERANSEIKIEY